jgi:hypothetical protein
MVFLCGTDQKPFKSGRFELGPETFLTMDLDPAWTTHLTYKERVATELSINHPDNPNEKCRIYIIPQTSSPNPETLIPMLRENGSDLLKKAMETDFSFIPLNSQKGYYYILTDKAPKAGEPPLLSRGGLISARHLVLFTILFEKKDAPFFKGLIKALSTTRITYPQS